VELKKKSVDMKALIKSVAASFAGKAKEKNLELRVDLPKNEELDLYIDEDRLIQVFTNLIGNSLKFTEKGHIEISCARRENEIEFTVSDTGIGIASEDLPRVFGKFLQFGRSPGAGEKGTGLGLSIAKGLIELHRGKIRVESQLGQGSKFIFTLPKYPAGQNAREYIEDAIAEAIKSSTRLSLVIVTFRHSDKIKEISQDLAEDLLKTVRSQLYRGRDLALLYPGEVFIIMRDCNRDSGVLILERIRQALSDYLDKRQLAQETEIKFGLAVYPDDGNSYQELINKAALSW